MKHPKAPDTRVRMSGSDTPISDSEVKGFLLNPSYVFGGIVDEDTFIGAAKRLIAEDGIEDYLTNLLFVMMRSLTPHIDPHEAIPSESDWLSWATATITDHGIEAGLKHILSDLRDKYGEHFAS